MQLELERRHDAEVPAAAAQGPEQVGFRARRGRSHVAVRRHDGGAEQVVDRHAMAPRQPAEAAAERQAGHAGGRVDAQRRRQAVRLRLAIEVAQQGAWADPRNALVDVDADRAHAGEVDRQAAFGDGVAGDVVAATAHAEQYAVRRRKTHSGLHVGLVRAARNERRAAVDGAVPDPARFIVGGVGAAERAAADLRREGGKVGRAQLPDVVVQRDVGQ